MKTFKPRLFSSHKIYWIFTNYVACFALPFIWKRKQYNECFWKRMTLPSWNLYKCKHIVTFLHFKKRLYMTSLIANQVQTNMCSVSVKHFIVLTTFAPVFTLNWYNYNNNLLVQHNYSLFCSQPFCKHCTYTLDLQNRDLQTRNHNTRLTDYNWLTFIFLRLLEKSTATFCICAFSHHAYCSCFRFAMYLLV